MKAWAGSLDPNDKSGIRFLADPSATFTSALDVTFENKPIFGGLRSKRYALEVKEGVVTAVHVEPDNTGVNGKSAHDHIATCLRIFSVKCRISPWESRILIKNRSPVLVYVQYWVCISNR